jgi:hypothetical protein
MPRVGFELTIPASKRAKTVYAFFFYLWRYWHCGHSWPIVPAPDDRCGWLWRSRWTVDWEGKPKFSEKTLPQRHFCPSQNPTWPDPGLNPCRHGGKPATNRLSYGAAQFMPFLLLLFGLWDHWHCGYSWPIVLASGDREDDCGESDEM